MGYLVTFVVPAILAAAVWQDLPSLVIAVVFLAFPLARLVFGALPAADTVGSMSARRSFALDLLPFIYAAMIIGLLCFFLSENRQRQLSLFDAAAWSVSLWLTFVFGTCVGHALLHSAKRQTRLLGHVLAGILGYPILGYEHNRHHRFAGNCRAAEWPYDRESLWRFAARRASKLFAETIGRDGLATRGDHRSVVVQGIRAGILATFLTFAAFSWALGAVGGFIYAVAVILVSFSIQMVTYLQHYGLSEPNVTNARLMQWGWEDDCRFQSWLTMGLSLHMAHHHDTNRPYYRLQLRPDSPRMPAGYLLLMFAAFVPPLWRRVMAPAVAYWQRNPASPPSAGRSLTCTAIYADTPRAT